MHHELAGLLAPGRLTHIVDIGANPVDGAQPYSPMLAAGYCRLTGFEPQAAEHARLEAAAGPNERYFPLAIGDGGPATLRVCAYSGWSSLFEPDPRMLALFPHFAQAAEVVERMPLETVRLDSLADLGAFDMLKIDVQGSELAIFQSAAALLEETVCIQTEVSFLSLYQGQPAQGDVDRFLREAGFVPHCFAGIKKTWVAPQADCIEPQGQINQLLEADLVYVRDFIDPAAMSDEQLKHLCLLVHHLYGSYDLAALCLARLVDRGAVGAEARDAYLAFLRSRPRPGPHPAA